MNALREQSLEQPLNAASPCHRVPLTSADCETPGQTFEPDFIWCRFSSRDLQLCSLHGKIKDVARVYMGDPLLERLAQDFEDIVGLRQLVSAQDPVVHQGDLFRQRYLAIADQTNSGDGVVRGVERAGGNKGRVPSGEARDTTDARGLDGFPSS
jgi:hypothetical protein